MAPCRKKLLGEEGKWPALDEGIAALGGSRSSHPMGKLRENSFWSLPTSGLHHPAKPKQQSLLAVLPALGDTGWDSEPLLFPGCKEE